MELSMVENKCATCKHFTTYAQIYEDEIGLCMDLGFMAQKQVGLEDSCINYKGEQNETNTD